jgi:hypothetical protein
MLVVQVPGVLPYVNVHQRYEVSLVVSDQVLVVGGSELEALATFVIYQPTPA